MILVENICTKGRYTVGRLSVLVCEGVQVSQKYAGQGGAIGGQGICEMWGEAFVYAEEGAGYVMNFTGENPNDAVNPTVTPPDPCPDHEVSTEDRDAACGDVRFPAALQYQYCLVCYLLLRWHCTFEHGILPGAHLGQVD